MLESSKKKICLVSLALGGGGAEKSVALLSKVLFQLGHEVHIVTVVNNVQYEFSGKLFNLGLIKDQNSGLLGDIKRLLAFKRFLRRHDFDFVIDNRTRVVFLKELIISKWLYNPRKTIYCIRSYYLDNYIPRNPVLARILYASSFKIIGNSNAITNELRIRYNLENIDKIYNPIENYLSDANRTSIDDDYIIFFGRLEEKVKNISLLLESYEKSKLPESGVKLVILGDGPDKIKLKEKAKRSLVSSSILFHDFIPNPMSIVSHAKFSVLTSRYEGFPRMLLESLSAGVPVISVNCKSGPDEIIEHGVNGLLVANNNAQLLAVTMNQMLNNHELYSRCKDNAIKSVEKFNFVSIGSNWQKVLMST